MHGQTGTIIGVSKQTRFPLSLVGLVLLAMLAGCGLASIAPVHGDSVSQWVSFVRDDSTTIEEVRARMGEPADTYENGHILIYMLCEEGKRLRSGMDCRGGRYYHLVLIFGIDGLLQRHSLVERN